MKRDHDRLKEDSFDILVIGGGIHGLCTAWDASLRGLSTALVEKGDFAGATSANSLKLIHGGLRYLQHADFRRLRQSVGEVKALMSIAPHLVHPFPSLVPSYGHGLKGREMMGLAFSFYNMLSRDRVRLDDPQKHLPSAGIIPAEEALGLFPGLRKKGLTGGAVFYDAQVYSTERLALSFALAASRAGAALANYTEVTGFMKEGRKLAGVRVRDVLHGEEFEVRARVIINTAGPWIDALLNSLTGRGLESTFTLAKAVNIVARHYLSRGYALGVESPEGGSDALVPRGNRLLFVAPWRDYSLIGTSYKVYHGHPDDLEVTEEDVMGLVNGINRAYPGAKLEREDVTYHHTGLVPITGEKASGEVVLAKAHRLIDHGRSDGVEGLITLVGVKYTTARDVARRAVDLACGKLKQKRETSRTAETPLPGGNIERFEEFLEKIAGAEPLGLGPDILRHLAYSYGKEYRRILEYVDMDPECGLNIPGSREVIRAEVIHAVREESALKLTDVTLRRTDLGSAENPGDEALRACAGIMSAELSWDEERLSAEIEEARAVYETGRVN
jgi:glycerol-3-phosphate dehydrogenase